MKIPAPNEQQAGAAAIPDDELDLIRSRYRLHSDANATSWALYDRALSVWRQQVSEHLIRLLTTPSAYAVDLAKKKEKRDRCTPSDVWCLEQECAANQMAYRLMQYARPGQSGLGLALEILGEDGSPRAGTLIRELCHGGWLPKEPKSPLYGIRRERERRAGITEAQRMANAEGVF